MKHLYGKIMRFGLIPVLLIGMIQRIGHKIAKDRDRLIRTEYDYAIRTYGIIDKSPTYAWESEIIPDIRKTERFKNLTFSTEQTCSH